MDSALPTFLPAPAARPRAGQRPPAATADSQHDYLSGLWIEAEREAVTSAALTVEPHPALVEPIHNPQSQIRNGVRVRFNYD